MKPPTAIPAALIVKRQRATSSLFIRFPQGSARDRQRRTPSFDMEATPLHWDDLCWCVLILLEIVHDGPAVRHHLVPAVEELPRRGLRGGRTLVGWIRRLRGDQVLRRYSGRVLDRGRGRWRAEVPRRGRLR